MLNSDNLILFDIHETVQFIVVLLQRVLYFSNVNMLGISKVGIHFFFSTLLILTYPLFPGTSLIYKLLNVFKVAK